MNLIQESYQRLFPEQEFPYLTKLGYNRRLADFNANVRKYRNSVEINLNLQWKDIDDEIKIGLIQHLLLKVFKTRKNTPNLELYHNFVKNIETLAPKTEPDLTLKSSFQRVNQQFFYSYLNLPNLRWGQRSFRKLASYNYHTDTVTVSTLFLKAQTEILDYLMYHELLHKDKKFQHKNGRSAYHTKEFKEAEKLYPNYREIEAEITLIIKNSRKRWWGLFRNI
ncbi:MAG TPA: hypothetical protein VJG49_03195 [Candidatus Nanoarchaeia archaeon]|nr:hypothetical protein [Candidatus Nanoarchaeia archaeon]